jgi:hypothetical protein
MQMHRVIKRTAEKLKFMPPRIHKETETETEPCCYKKVHIILHTSNAPQII